MIPALYVLSFAATVLAWRLARDRPEHRPVAWLLTVGLASDLAIRLLRLYVTPYIERLGIDARWSGAPRVAGHVADALLLAWPATMAGAALVVFLGLRAWPVLLGYFVAIGALVVTHPIAGDGSLGRALTACNLIALAVGVGCAATWYMRTEKDGDTANSARAALMLILSIELPSLSGAWRLGIFNNWHLSRIAYLVLYSLLIIIQGGWLWPNLRSSRPS